MKKRFFNGFLAVAMLIASVGTFVSCKDHEEDNYSDLKGQLAEQNATLRELIDAQIANLQSQIKKLEEAQIACKQECAAKIAELQAYSAATYETKEHANAVYDKLNNDIAALKTVDAQLSLAIETLKTTTKEAIDKANGRIDEVLSVINDIQIALAKAESLAQKAFDQAQENKNTIEIWTPKWESTMKDASDALAKAIANEEMIKNLIKSHEDYEASAGAKDAEMAERIDSIVNALKDFQNSEALDAVREMAEKAYNDAVAYTNLQIGAVNEKINTLNSTIAELKAAYADADKKLADELKTVKDGVDALTQRVNANEQAVAKMTGEIEALWNALKSQVTGIILQGTYNPVLGSAALPLDIRSNILAAFYGEAMGYGLEFPTSRPGYYVDQSIAEGIGESLSILGKIEKESYDSGEILFGEEGNAGSLYLTINPNTVDFTGVELPVVNSLDEEAGVKLSGLQKSWHKLTFGYTRADNGFYEAKATINEASLETIKKISIEDIKNVATDLIGKGVSVSTIANTLYNTLNEIEMDAHGVKATWNDGVQDHSVYSQYGIAAAAIKPLGFSFGKEFNYKKVPGIDRAENLVGKIIDKINVDFPDFDFEMSEFKIQQVEIVKLDDKTLAKFKVEIKDENGKVIDTIDLTEAIEDLYGNMTAPIEDINAMLADLQAYIDDVNNLIGEMKKVTDIEDNINNIKGDIKTELSKYLDNFNSKLCNIINSTNKALRPVLLVKTKEGYGKLSQAANIPTRVSGTKFIVSPTSYTAEYLAPAFKKFVAVTNVSKGNVSAKDGDATCMSILKAANSQEGYAKVIDGGKQLMEFTAEEGYVYEFLYMAADYYGFVDAKKFYVVAE